MLVFSILLVTIRSVSTTDCYPSSATFWELHGKFQVNQSNIYFTYPEKEESQSYIEYTSKRHRKKWMISLCGFFEDSFLNFSSSDESQDNNHQHDNISIEIQKGTDKSIFHYLNVKLMNNKNIHKETKVKYSYKEPTCFNIIYGRGFFGMFSTKDAHKQEGDQIFALQIKIPRKHIFRYYSRKPSNISYLCVGDFFGNKRLSVKPDNNHWDPHIKDFL